MKSALVSVVVPCHNARRFLAETLESVFEQTYPNIEIVVVDDGSTDGSAELICSYGDKLKAEFGPNRGVSAARNRGTALAVGEFVQYLDADDIVPSDAIERRVAALQSSGADVAYSDWERFIENSTGVFEPGERVAKQIKELDQNPTVAHLKFWAPPAALTYRRSIITKIGGWKEWLPVIQDARFLQDAALAGGQFVHVPGVGAKYRVHRGPSVSRRSEAAFVADVFRNACDLQAIFEEHGVMNVDLRRAFAQNYDYAARTLFFSDSTAYRDCVARIRALDQGFRSKWVRAAELTSSILGVKAARQVLGPLKKLFHAISPRQ